MWLNKSETDSESVQKTELETINFASVGKEKV